MFRFKIVAAGVLFLLANAGFGQVSKGSIINKLDSLANLPCSNFIPYVTANNNCKFYDDTMTWLSIDNGYILDRNNYQLNIDRYDYTGKRIMHYEFVYENGAIFNEGGIQNDSTLYKYDDFGRLKTQIRYARYYNHNKIGYPYYYQVYNYHYNGANLDSITLIKTEYIIGNIPNVNDVDTLGVKITYTYNNGRLKSKEVKGNIIHAYQLNGHPFDIKKENKEEYFYDNNDSISKIKYYKGDGTFDYEVNYVNSRIAGKGTVLKDYGTYLVTDYYNSCNQLVGFITQSKLDTLYYNYETRLFDDFGIVRNDVGSPSQKPRLKKITTRSNCYNILDTIVVPFVKDSICITTNNSITTCDSVIINGNNYDSSQVIINKLRTVLGCDSIVITNLIINKSKSVLQNITSCDFVIINGVNYDSSQVIIDTLKTVTGCDSIVKTNLTIKKVVFVNQNLTVCNSALINGKTYTNSQTVIDTLIGSNGCDSILTINLLIVTQFKDTVYRYECEPTVINGNLYSVSQTITDTLITKKGCDSILTTNLIINSQICSNKTLGSGQQHSLVICNDNLWAWGSNSEGQFGNGTFDVSLQTTPINITGINKVKSIGGNTYYTAFLKEDGTIWHWGYNEFVPLAYDPLPSQVLDIKNVNAIAVGGEQSLALKKDGTVWAWGQINLTLPTLEAFDLSKKAVKVQGLENVIAIANNNQASLALKGDSTVWEWKYDLGFNDGSNVPVKIDTLSSIKLIAVGSKHFVVVDADNVVLEWRKEKYTDPKIFRKIIINDVKAIETGENYTLALKIDGTVWAWGENKYGQLGDGTNNSSLQPVKVIGLSNIVEIETYSNHALAKDDKGNIWTWGLNATGQLGDSTSIDRSLPVRINLCRQCVVKIFNQTISVCGSASVNGKTYTSSQIVKDTLFAASSKGCDSIVVTNLTINAKPTANYTVSTSKLVASFVNTSTNSNSVSWSYGDGKTATQNNTSNIYTTAGTYTVCIVASNTCGSDSICKQLIVKDSVKVVSPLDELLLYMDSLTNLPCNVKPYVCSTTNGYYTDTIFEMSTVNNITFLDSSNSNLVVNVFDANHKIQAHIWYGLDNYKTEIIDSIVFFYGTNNKVIKERHYYYYNNGYYDWDREYNANNNLTTSTQRLYSKDGTFIQVMNIETYEYDAKDSLKAVYRNGGNSPILKYENNRIGTKGHVKLWFENSDTTKIPNEIRYYNSCNQLVGFVYDDGHIYQGYVFDQYGVIETIETRTDLNYVFESDYSFKHSRSICNDIDTALIDTNNCYTGVIIGSVFTGTNLLSSGKVTLYTNGGNKVKEVALVNGTYKFDPVALGGYKLYAEGEYGTYKLVPEYYDNAQTWQTAKAINIGCKVNYLANFNLAEEVVLGGKGSIKGIVGNTSAPKQGVQLFLYLASSPNIVLQTATTNANGEYEFLTVPSNNYILKIDAVSYTSISSSVQVTAQDLNKTVNFCLLGSSITACNNPVGIEDVAAEKISFTAYPNPFENEITIQFELDEQAEVELAVYNTLGQKVAVLLEGKKPSGVHKVNYGANNASLIYVLQLKVNNQVYFKRISKIK